MKYLIVVAHPDDEVLGAGASIWKWAHDGDEVDVCIMCAEAKARAFRPSDAELEGDTDAAVSFLGVKRKFEGTFPNIEMNTVSHLKLVQFIEAAIRESEPDVIITHHPADTNNDHLQTSMACQEAIRLFQRRPEVKRVREFWYMEVPSCTEWAVNAAMNLFRPNCYEALSASAVGGVYRGPGCVSWRTVGNGVRGGFRGGAEGVLEGDSDINFYN